MPNYRQPTASSPRSPVPHYSADDPWNTARFNAVPSNDGLQRTFSNGAPSSLSGTGLPKDWWKKQETVNVNILGQQGFLLNRYTVYEISSDVSAQCTYGEMASHCLSCRGVRQFLDDTRNLSFCGTVSCEGIHSGYFLHYHPNEYSVSDQYCLTGESGFLTTFHS